MKKIILAITFGFSVVSAFCQQLEWSKSMNGLNEQIGSDIKMDENILIVGRVNVCGFFSNYGIQRNTVDVSIDNTFDTDGQL